VIVHRDELLAKAADAQAAFDRIEDHAVRGRRARALRTGSPSPVVETPVCSRHRRPDGGPRSP
jgi:hypothetical protein